MKIALATLITAFIIAAALGPILIPVFRWMKFRQTISKGGYAHHGGDHLFAGFCS